MALTISRPTVFVVDNDWRMHRRLERLCELKGYRVQCFASAAAFLQQELGAEPACLVLEADLPGLTGLELQRFLLGRGVLLPIIFITANGDIRTAVRALQSGAISFLAKPLDGDELAAAIENAFAVWREESVVTARWNSHRAQARRTAAGQSAPTVLSNFVV